MRILLGMSGGLDSTYAAKKLLLEGNTVEGAVLRMHKHTEVDSAVEAAQALDIPIHQIDCSELFERTVIDNFVSQYLLARTPNPCIVCNSEVKLFALYDFAMKNGFDAIATGHYARVILIEGNNSPRYALKKAKDLRKDQTYMLWRVPQHILSKLILPLADEEKSEIRENARRAGLTAADREESQEICFIPDNDYASFIEERTGECSHGSFVDEKGRVLGEHKGIIRYTVGQRKGLGIAMGQRVFVTKIDPSSNTVTLSENDSYSDRFTVSDMVFSGIEEPAKGEKITLLVKVRYLARPVECELEYLGNSMGKVRLVERQRALTPGQSAVFYNGDTVVAGGFISLENT